MKNSKQERREHVKAVIDYVKKKSAGDTGRAVDILEEALIYVITHRDLHNKDTENLELARGKFLVDVAARYRTYFPAARGKEWPDVTYWRSRV